MTAQELKETGQRLFKSGQFAEAIPLLKSAAEALPKDEPLWQELVMSARDSGQHGQAVEFAKLGIRHHPRSDWLWRTLGSELVEVDKLDEAEKALNNSRTLNSGAPWLWRHFIKLHQRRKNYAKEIEAWENLRDLDEMSGTDLNCLGIAYHNHGNYAKAVEFYRQSAAESDDTAALFNMGLVFNLPEVSQDADAADAYRRALALNPQYEKAQERLEATKKKLLPLAERVRSEASGLIRAEEFFQFYINPFEVFPIEFDGELSKLDPKTIQRAKKRLLGEIELNDGKVEWLENQEVDRARALALEDELYDEVKRRFHWTVFENKQLLRFLTRGEIDHFLYSDEYFPGETLQLLDEEPEFRDFVSKPFARQYNLLLSRSIERRALATIEALFDGRRWVAPEDEDICFEGANKRISDLVGVMRELASEVSTRKVSVREVEDFLRQHSFTELFNLLPTPFAPFQKELVAEVRSLAIACYNDHGDPDLSKGVLNLCKKFTSRSVELTQKLDEDFKIIEKKIAEERKAEVKLQFGQERPFEITKEGIKDGTKFFPTKTIKALRWGITITGYTGAERYEYVIVVTNDNGVNAMASWSTPKADEEKQTEFFSKMVNACLNYLAEAVVEKIQHRLNAGNAVQIGSCGLSRQGVSFQTQGIIFKKDRFVSWSDMATEIRNGQVVVSSKSQHGLATSVSMKDTDNAVLLPFIRSVMEKVSNQPPIIR